MICFESQINSQISKLHLYCYRNHDLKRNFQQIIVAFVMIRLNLSTEIRNENKPWLQWKVIKVFECSIVTSGIEKKHLIIKLMQNLSIIPHRTKTHFVSKTQKMYKGRSNEKVRNVVIK